MELRLNKEPVFLSETVFDGQNEQGVELDYVLPDYYPDIFKILKCTITPGIASYSLSGSQLFYDGTALVRVMYIGEEGGEIHCIEQRYTYSKAVDLPKPCEKGAVKLRPKTDYANCRAVSPRRIDVRGAISCKIKISAVRETEIISGAQDLEIKRFPLTYCSDKLVAQRLFAVREDIETGTGAIVSVLSADVCAQVSDTKIIADKAIVKGTAKVKALYCVKRNDMSNDTEVMEADIPLSQIIELEGVTDEHICFSDFCVMDMSLEIKTSEGESSVIGCSMTVDCTVTAYKESAISVVTDIYSTKYETSFIKAPVKTEFAPQPVSKQLTLRSSLECTEGALEEIYDCRLDLSNIICRRNDENEMLVSGQCLYQAIGRTTGGTPVFIEKSEAFELSADFSGIDCASVIDPDLRPQSVSFSISDDRTVEIRAILALDGCLLRVRSVDVISEVVIDSDKPKAKNTDYALKMYFAEPEEEVWEIAKRYNTSSSAIMAENDLDCDTLSQACMLLIPIV